MELRDWIHVHDHRLQAHIVVKRREPLLLIVLGKLRREDLRRIEFLLRILNFLLSSIFIIRCFLRDVTSLLLFLLSFFLSLLSLQLLIFLLFGLGQPLLLLASLVID